MAFLHGIEIEEIEGGVRPIRSVRSNVIGIVGTAPDASVKFPLNTPVLLTSDKGIAGIGETGTLPDALALIYKQGGAVVVVIRVDQGADDAATLANVVGGVDGGTGERKGVTALLNAKSIVKVTPKILIAPDFSNEKAVADELIGVADRLRAVAVIEGSNTTDAEAKTYADSFDSSRAYMIDPAVKIFTASGDKVVGASSAVAGLIAQLDFWVSPSNKVIKGIVGVARAVDFELGDANSSANLLNEKRVATIVFEQGYRLWGNLSLSSDPKWQFINVRRSADVIASSLLAAHLWAVDKGITKTYFADVTEGVKRYLRSLQGRGAILGGDCWYDPDINTADQIQLGKATWDFDFTPVYPAQTVTFRSNLTDKYIKNLF